MTVSSFRSTEMSVIVRTLREAVRVVRLEAAEVVPALQTLGGPLHCGGVEGLLRLPGVASQERVLHAAVVNDVAVSLGDGVLIRVECLADFVAV